MVGGWGTMETDGGCYIETNVSPLILLIWFDWRMIWEEFTRVWRPRLHMCMKVTHAHRYQEVENF